MLIARDIARMLDPVLFAKDCGIELDPWQSDLMRKRPRKALLNCSRQSGKTTTTALIALETACNMPGSTTVIGAPVQRQSGEMLRTIKKLHSNLQGAPEFIGDSVTKAEFDNGSRIVALAGDPKTVRGIAAPALIVVDEAAFADDELIEALRPMQATLGNNYQLIALSTPNGCQGWFHKTWHSGDSSWMRVRVAARDCPRISADFLAEQLREIGPTRFAQEYDLAFLDGDTAAFNSELIDRMFTDEVQPLWT